MKSRKLEKLIKRDFVRTVASSLWEDQRADKENKAEYIWTAVHLHFCYPRTESFSLATTSTECG